MSSVGSYLVGLVDELVAEVAAVEIPPALQAGAPRAAPGRRRANNKKAAVGPEGG